SRVPRRGQPVALVEAWTPRGARLLGRPLDEIDDLLELRHHLNEGAVAAGRAGRTQSGAAVFAADRLYGVARRLHAGDLFVCRAPVNAFDESRHGVERFGRAPAQRHVL